MSSIFSLGFIFSVKGITSILLLYFLWFILQDYPQWKLKNQQKKDTTKKDGKGKEQSAPINLSTTKKPPASENLSTIHYIIAAPFATSYVVGRTILERIRYALYYLLWTCEKLMPYVDDWLFEVMTVRLPQTYNQVARWWDEKGKEKLIKCKKHIQIYIIPKAVQYVETTAICVYKAGCVVYAYLVDFIETCKRFIQRFL